MLAPENARYVRRAADYLLSWLQDALKAAPGASGRQHVAAVIARLGLVLAGGSEAKRSVPRDEKGREDEEIRKDGDERGWEGQGWMYVTTWSNGQSWRNERG